MYKGRHGTSTALLLNDVRLIQYVKKRIKSAVLLAYKMTSKNCNPSAVVKVSKRGALLKVVTIPCSRHGHGCSKATAKQYILIANDESGNEFINNRVITWNDLCEENFQSPLLSYAWRHALLLACEPLDTGLRVLQASYSSRGSSTLEDQMARMSMMDHPRSSVKKPLEVSVVRDTTFSMARIQWNTGQKSRRHRPNQWMIVITRPNESKTAIAHFYVKGAYWYFDLPLKLSGGAEYRVQVKALNKIDGNDLYSYVDAEGTATFKADLTASDLAILYERAFKYTLSNEPFAPITPCNWFYRNKSDHYFDDIMFWRRGIMEVYIKDGSGDLASTINGAINGLFFMAKNENGFPPRESAFGPTRLQVPSHVLLRQAPNMYFADFFCMHGKTHVVTVVLTTPYSEVDEFCRDHLLPLDISKNPFLFRRGNGLYTANRRWLNVEVFFTENIDVNYMLRKGALFSRCPIPMNCKGRSSPRGIQKNPSCVLCNIRSPISSELLAF